jgi:hypothetical protein
MQGLDDAVGRAGDDLEAAAERVDRLVMHAVDVQPAPAGEAVQRRSGFDVRGVRHLVGRLSRPVLEVRQLGDVLVQRPARGDVERLHAAADGEQREVALAGRAHHRELVVVRDAVDVRAELRVPQRPVGSGVEVGAAAEQDAVEAVEERVRVVGEPVRREHDGDPARLAHGLHVREPEVQACRAQITLRSTGRGGPGRGRILAQLVRDDADQWGACVPDEPLYVFGGCQLQRASR